MAFSLVHERPVSMKESAAQTVTTILTEARDGDSLALSRLMPLLYDELRELAEGLLRRERPDSLLQPTALVHEAYLKLVDYSQVDWRGRTHFLAAAAEAIRRVLVDYARRRGTAKRGGGWNRVTMLDVGELSGGREADVLAMDETLTKLAALDARQSRIVELRFFGGLEVKAVAYELGVSVSTVEKDWRMAKAWLHAELSKGDDP